MAGNYSDLENDDNHSVEGGVDLQALREVKFTEDTILTKEDADAETEEIRSQTSMTSTMRLLSKNHPFLEGLFGAIYVIAKENNLYRFFAMITLLGDVVQLLSYLYWPEFHWGVSAFQNALFYSHLDGGAHKVFWLWASLALVLFLLLSAVAIQFKLKGAVHSVKLVRLLRLVAGATTTILCIPIITALVKPFECMVRGSDADWFSESCYSGEHIASVITSILLLLPLAPLIVVIAVTYYDPSPTLHRDLFTRSSSRHDAFFTLAKMGLVVCFTLLIDWPAIPVLVLGGTSLGLGVMYYHFPPFHLVLLNWVHTGFFSALALVSLVQMSVVIDGSNGVTYFAVSIVALLIAFGGGVWLARRKSLLAFKPVQGGTIDARKWHRPWDVEMSAFFLMPHLYQRVDENNLEDSTLDGDEDEEEQHYIFDERCADRLKAIYSRGVRRYPHSAFLRLRFAMFLTNVVCTPESTRAARGHVLRAMKMHQCLDLQFTIYYLRKLWEHEHETSGMGESKMDIISSIEMQRNFKVASRSYHRAKHHIGTFWNLLLDGNADPDALASVIENIEKHEVNAQRAYTKLINRFPNSVKVLREYGTFCADVKNDQEVAQRVYALADRLEEEQSRVGGLRTRKRRSSSSHSDNDEERQSVCSMDRASGIESSCGDSSEGITRSTGRSSFIQRSRIQKPPQIKMLNMKLWIVLSMILAVVITMAVLSEVNTDLHHDTTTHMVEALGGQANAQLITLYVEIMRTGSISVPPFTPDLDLVIGARATITQHLEEFKDAMHSAYPRRFAFYGFDELKGFWENEDLCTQFYAGNGQYTEECMNYWEAVTRFITYVTAVLEASETLHTEEEWGGYVPFRWVIDNSYTVMKEHGMNLSDIITKQEDWILSIHFITMLCFTLGSCAVTILAMAFFIRPAVVTIREGRDAMLSLFQDIPRDIVLQRRDFYNKNAGEDHETSSIEFSGGCKKKWSSLRVSLVATGVICVLIVTSGVVSITLIDGLSARCVRCMAEREVFAYNAIVGSMEVLHDDGIRALTLQGAINNWEGFVDTFTYVTHSLRFGCSKHHSPPPALNPRVAEVMYEKLSDTHPKPLDTYMTLFLDGMKQLEREVTTAYPTQLSFSESSGFSSMFHNMLPVIDGLSYLTKEIMSELNHLNKTASTTILVVAILCIVSIVLVYYVVLIQHVVRRLYHESRRTMRMFLLIPEKAITQSDGLRRFLESNGTDYRKKGSTTTKVETNSSLFLQEGILTIDTSSGSIVAANTGACELFGYNEMNGKPWPGLDALMPDVDLEGSDVIALRTEILVAGGGENHGSNAIRAMYDLHHLDSLSVVKVRRLRATEGDILSVPLHNKMLYLSGKPLMLLDEDGFPQAAQDALLALVGYSCVADLPHIRSLLPSIDADTPSHEEILTDIVCKGGVRKPVYVEYWRSDTGVGIVTLTPSTHNDPDDVRVRSSALLPQCEQEENGTTGARKRLLSKGPQLSPLPSLISHHENEGTASAV